MRRGEECHVPITGGESIGDSSNRIDGDAIDGNEIGDEGSSAFSEPDYDYLVNDDDEQSNSGSGSDVASSPDYDHLGLDYDDLSATYLDDDGGSGNGIQEPDENILISASSKGPNTEAKATMGDCCYAEESDVGEEYILGTMMVRVLEARHVKSNPSNQGGGIVSLISNHRRSRHKRSTMSPASGGGNLTPYSNQQLYATLSFTYQSQLTSIATDHNMNGNYHWSRGDQSYFDVTCPAFPLRMGKMQHTTIKGKQTTPDNTSAPQRDDVSCAKLNQQQTKINDRFTPSLPLLQLSLYSKNPGGASHKQNKWMPHLNSKDEVSEKNDDYLIGKCSINILRIISGKTPYFDEWCTLHSDAPRNNNDFDETAAGRIRIVIEYEPTDPPPRPGDMCVFANVYPLADELYPIPLYSIQNTVRPVRSSMSMSTMSSTSLSSLAPSASSYIPSVVSHPKKYRVEEVVGDHVVLSYQTPENWLCTFEVHRYLLLCVERHQAAVEKYKERVLDLCDNVSQSPAVDALTKTVESLPDEGLVYVGADLVGGGVGLLGRWWENGVDGMVEDVVDGINLDGRYSHLSEEEEEDGGDGGTEVQNQLHGQFTNLSSPQGGTNKSDASQDERKAIPGMPCCPITGISMINPVVAADGHTYERHAISRWLQTSNRSPLTGEVLAHVELVPNYLLLSSLGDASKLEGGDGVCSDENMGLLDLL